MPTGLWNDDDEDLPYTWFVQRKERPALKPDYRAKRAAKTVCRADGGVNQSGKDWHRGSLVSAEAVSDLPAMRRRIRPAGRANSPSSPRWVRRAARPRRRC